MARKLDETEQRMFAEALLLTEMVVSKQDASSLMEVLVQKRDAPLQPSSELAGWLDHLWAKDIS